MKKAKVIDERGKVHHISAAALKGGGGEHHVHVHIHIHGPEDATGSTGYGYAAGYSGYAAGYSGYAGSGYAGYGKTRKRPARKSSKSAPRKRR